MSTNEPSMVILEDPSREGLRYGVWDKIFGRRTLVAAFLTRELAEAYRDRLMYGDEE